MRNGELEKPQISTSYVSPSDPLNRMQLQSIRSSYRSMTSVRGRRMRNSNQTKRDVILRDSAMDDSRCIKMPREWLGVVCTLLLLTESVLCDGADWKKEQECYNYAGGHVYPGEASRVPVSDHSLHLSKAKSAFRAFMHMQIICLLNAFIKIKYLLLNISLNSH